MKRLIASVTLLLLLACYMWSCEKDDICADGTPTTPSLMVEFYNNTNQTALKSVTGLKYYVVGMQDTLSPGTVSNIKVPLRVDTTAVKWGFILNTSSISGTIHNTDYLEFKYTPRNEYVSRACGYKTLFTMDTPSQANPNPVLTNGTDNPTLWIDHCVLQTVKIDNEDVVHLKIYF